MSNWWIFVGYAIIVLQRIYGDTEFKDSCLKIHRPSIYISGSCLVLYEGNDKSRSSAATTCATNHKNGHLAFIYNQQEIDQLHTLLDLTVLYMMPVWCALMRDPDDSSCWVFNDEYGTSFQLKSPPWDSNIANNPASIGDGVLVSKDGMSNDNITSRHPFLCQFAEPTVLAKFKSRETDKNGSSDQSLGQWSMVSIHSCAESCAEIAACQSFGYSSVSKECHLYFVPTQQLDLSASSGSKIFDKIHRDADCINECTPSDSYLMVIDGAAGAIEAYYPQEPDKGGTVATLDSIRAECFSRNTSLHYHQYRNSAPAVWYDGKILIVGGSPIYGNHLKSVILFDVETNGYTYVEDTSVARDRPGSTSLHGAVVLCGGGNPDTGQDEYSCEKFIDYHWESLTPMNAQRHAVKMANLNNRLYAMGGYSDAAGSFVLTVERFDPTTDQWSTLNDLPNRYLNVWSSAVVFQGDLIACWGLNSGNGCDKYDQFNDQWTSMAVMNEGRWGLGLVVGNGVLYAVGGQDDTGVRRTVEYYNHSTESWELIPTLYSLSVEVISMWLWCKCICGSTIHVIAFISLALTRANQELLWFAVGL